MLEINVLLLTREHAASAANASPTVAGTHRLPEMAPGLATPDFSEFGACASVGKVSIDTDRYALIRSSSTSLHSQA